MVDGLVLHREGNDALAELDPDVLSDAELEELLVELHRETQRLCAERARFTAAYDTRKAYAHDGSKSAAARLARKTKACPGTIRQHVLLGKRLRLMSEASQALAAGDISVEHAQVLGKLAGSSRRAVADAFVGAERQLVEFAKDLEFDDFVRAVRYWEQCADQDGAEEKAAKQYQSRRLHLSQTLDGTFVLDALLDAVGGAAFATALRRIEQELFRADWDEARQEHGDDTQVDHLARTPAQRRADALVEMAQRAMAMPPGARKPRPLITVHVGFETFAGRLCELSNGTVIAPGQIVPLLAQAEIERAVFAGPKRIIELGERTRFFTGGLRRCVEVIHRYCTHPGCDVPAEECQIDHVEEYEDGGRTTQRNGEPRCETHNVWKHNQKRKRRRARHEKRRRLRARPPTRTGQSVGQPRRPATVLTPTDTMTTPKT